MTVMSEGAAESGKDAPAGPLVIFDCDGVLVETEAVSARVNRRILASMGWNVEPSEFARRFVGRSYGHFIAEIEHHLGARFDFDWEERYGHLHQEAYERELTAVPGIRKVLAQLAFPFCVASNASHDHVRTVLEMTGLLPYFQGKIFSADDVGIGKPAPDLFLHAARNLGHRPSQCLVVEDSLVGVEAAVAARMPVVGYAGGLTAADALADLATWTIGTMHDLPRVIGEHADSLLGSPPREVTDGETTR
jgi:HAD superfamily hydrolase (TIGR01509 family)